MTILVCIVIGIVVFLAGATAAGWFFYSWGCTEGRLAERTHRSEQSLKLESARREHAAGGNPWATYADPPSNRNPGIIPTYPGGPSYTPKATPRPDADTVAGGFPAAPGYLPQDRTPAPGPPAPFHLYHVPGNPPGPRHAGDQAPGTVPSVPAGPPRHAAAPVNSHPYPQMIP